MPERCCSWCAFIIFLKFILLHLLLDFSVNIIDNLFKWSLLSFHKWQTLRARPKPRRKRFFLVIKYSCLDKYRIFFFTFGTLSTWTYILIYCLGSVQDAYGQWTFALIGINRRYRATARTLKYMYFILRCSLLTFLFSYLVYLRRSEPTENNLLLLAVRVSGSLMWSIC